MFTTENPKELRVLLNAFRVPMFVVEQVDEDEDFRLLAINETHERTSDMTHAVFRGRRISEILSEPDARKVNRRYAECLTSGKPMEYRETLTMVGREQEWNMSLLPVASETGRKRIVGTAILIRACRAQGRTRRVFEDIQYFSVQSEYQLSRVSAYLEAIAETGDHDFRPGDLRVLAGMCRSIDRTMHDIRDLAEPMLSEDGEGSPPYLLSRDDDAHHDPGPGTPPVSLSLDRLAMLLDQMRVEARPAPPVEEISLYRA